MDKEYFFNLTSGVYKVTELFPKGEPLKFKIREKALEILENLILISSNPGINQSRELVKKKIFSRVEIITSYFDLAQTQDWVDTKNFLVLKREYGKIKRYLEAEFGETGFHQPEKACGRTETGSQIDNKNLKKLNSRQKKIIEVLKKKEKAQAGEILNFFEGVTKRTLRRELGRLTNEGAIKRVGRCNQIFYKLPD